MVLSNASTKVKIADVEYTAAEAIEMKNHGIEFEEQLMKHLRNQYSKAQMRIENENGESLEKRAENYVTGLYENKESKTNVAEVEKLKAKYIEQNQYELIDPLKILDKIEDLEKRINDFMAEVDSTLSVSNALTEITIEY